MFVVHLSQNGKNTTRDYGHVNQFFRDRPLFRQAKDEPIFKECVERGFIYISEYFVSIPNGRWVITYHKTLDLLLDEVAYNRSLHNGRAIK